MKRKTNEGKYPNKISKFVNTSKVCSSLIKKVNPKLNFLMIQQNIY